MTMLLLMLTMIAREDANADLSTLIVLGPWVLATLINNDIPSLN